jgi:hypothetical protein
MSLGDVNRSLRELEDEVRQSAETAAEHDDQDSPEMAAANELIRQAEEAWKEASPEQREAWSNELRNYVAEHPESHPIRVLREIADNPNADLETRERALNALLLHGGRTD